MRLRTHAAAAEQRASLEEKVGSSERTREQARGGDAAPSRIQKER